MQGSLVALSLCGCGPRALAFLAQLRCSLLSPFPGPAPSPGQASLSRAGRCPCGSQVPKEDVERKPVGGTKMDKDILAHTMERLRSGVIHSQVVSGREFKGCPFNSKPKVIHFKVSPLGVLGHGRGRGMTAPLSLLGAEGDQILPLGGRGGDLPRGCVAVSDSREGLWAPGCHPDFPSWLPPLIPRKLLPASDFASWAHAPHAPQRGSLGKRPTFTTIATMRSLPQTSLAAAPPSRRHRAPL